MTVPDPSDRIFNVLFLCTHNSARSIMAEAILNRRGAGRFRAYSAGSHPKSAPNPYALALLARLGHDVTGLVSKNWDVFAAPGAPSMDLVITVCDDAAGETCPVWIGHPAKAHWGIPDPSRASGAEAEIALAFAEAYGQLERRIDLLLALPVATLEGLGLDARLREIGRSAGATDQARRLNAPEETA